MGGVGGCAPAYEVGGVKVTYMRARGTALAGEATKASRDRHKRGLGDQRGNLSGTETDRSAERNERR